MRAISATLSLLITVGLHATSTIAPCAAQAPAVEQPVRGSSKIEEIVVHARKRDELLQDTPVSVTALSGQVLEDNGITRLDEIQTLVPNTFFQVGRSNQDANLRMRGVGAGSNEIAFDPGVGVYVDGVYIPRALGMLVELFDVRQIEVLRGPQGTLFGKNTVGGAILIQTIRPQPETYGTLSVNTGLVRDFHDLNSAVARAMLNVPLVEDRILGRFSFMSKNAAGYVADATQAGNKSDVNSYTFLGSLRFLPTEDLTIDLDGTWGRDHNNGRGGQCVFFNEAAPLKNVVPGFIDACRRSRPYSISTNLNGISDLESMGVWTNAEWDFGAVGFLENLTIKGIGSWRRQLPRIREDLDSTELGVIQISSVGGSLQDGIPGSQEQYSSELLLNSEAWDNRLNIVSGAFGFWETGRVEPTTLAGGSLPVPLSESTAMTAIDNWSWAIFTQATVDVTDWLSLTGGVRYTEDKKGQTSFIRDQRFPDMEPTLDESARRVFDRWTGMASAALTAPEAMLDPTPLGFLMGYYRFSQGFRGGGFNGLLGSESADTLLPFDQELLDNHEIGIKLTALEDRLTANLAYFYGDYQDIQVITIQGIQDPTVPTGLRIERITRNAAAATVQGFELEFRAIPTPGLSFTGSFGWIDATYDSFDQASDELSFCTEPEFNAGECFRDRSGEGFDRTPRLESSLITQYEYPLDVDSPTFAGTIIPQFTWTYRDNYHLFSRQVTPLIQHGFHLFNARLAYEFLETRMMVALWGKNLTNEAYFNEGTPIQSSFGSVTRYFALPRTFGAEVSYQF